MKRIDYLSILIVGCVLSSHLVATAQAAAGTAPGTQQGQTPGGPPPATGPVPPRDPRIKAPKTEESTIPGNVTVPGLPAGAANAVAQRPLNADEAVRIAIKLHPDVLNARAAVIAQRGRTRQTRAATMPQVIVAGSYTRVTTLSGAKFGGNSTPGVAGSSSSGNTTTNSGGSSSSGSTSSTTTSTTTSSTTPPPAIGLILGADVEGTLRQLIFDFNHTRDLIRQSRALERAADQNLSRVICDVAFEVKQTYYQYKQAIRLEQVNALEVTNRQSQLDLATSRYNVGLGQPGDVYSAQTAKAEAILNLEVARDNVEQARISLAIAMGVDPRTPVQIGEVEEPALVREDVNALVTQSLKERPEAIQALENLRSARFAVSAAKSTNAPVVSGAMNVYSAGDEILPQNDYLTVGLTLSWNPFDGGLTKGRVDEARANVLAAQSQVISIEQTIKADVTSAYVNLRNVERRVDAANADVANAEQNVNVAEQRYKTGIGQFADIINAQAFLLTARINRVSTLTLIPIYRAAVARAIGTKYTP